MVLFDWQYFQFNMIVLGDILRMIILFIQCGLRVSTHDDFHVLNEVSFYINNLSHEWRGKKFYCTLIYTKNSKLTKIADSIAC